MRSKNKFMWYERFQKEVEPAYTEHFAACNNNPQDIPTSQTAIRVASCFVESSKSSKFLGMA